MPAALKIASMPAAPTNWEMSLISEIDMERFMDLLRRRSSGPSVLFNGATESLCRLAKGSTDKELLRVATPPFCRRVTWGVAIEDEDVVCLCR